MDKLIACCGLDCNCCQARIATINNDDLRIKVAEEWSKLNGVLITKEMINCDDCYECPLLDNCEVVFYNKTNNGGQVEKASAKFISIWQKSIYKSFR